MKTLLTVITLCLLASCSTVKVPTSKLEQEAARLKEERKVARRNINKPTIKLIHITLFASASFFLWFETRDDWRTP